MKILFRSTTLALLAMIVVAASFCVDKTNGTKYVAYIGTYTNHGGKGIYAYGFDDKTGELKPLGVSAETASPSFLAIDSSHRTLYAVNEIDSFRDESTGSISSFAIGRDGKLSLLNQVSSAGPGPAYIALDRSSRYALVANYSRGNIAVFPILKDVSLGPATAVVQHHGSSVNPARQQGPHAHWIEASPDNRFILVADLGIDQVLTYAFNQSDGTLGQARITKITPGAGPRHLTFAPSGKFLYLINELQSTVVVFSYLPSDGSLSQRQTISTLPENFKDKNAAAEVAADASGKFLYASNRGDDSIAVFAINQTYGTVRSVQYVSTEGKTPRNFAIDPTGKWLLAANQDSDRVVVFRIDAATGQLKPTGQSVQVLSPACIKFAPM